MITNYKTRPAPTYQMMMKSALDVNSKLHPVHREVLKHTGVINLVAEVREDTQMISDLKIPGVVAFVCFLKIGNELVGVGRSTAVINGNATKFFEKTVLYCKNAAIIDSVVKSVKILDSLQPNVNNQPNPDIKLKLDESYQVKEVEGSDDGATEKQLNYLRTLIKTNVAENKRNEMEKQIAGYSRDEASFAIQQFCEVKRN